MRGVTRLSQLIRGFSSGVGKSASPAAPVDPMKNVVGEFFCRILKNQQHYKIAFRFSGLTQNCVKPNEAKNVPGTGNEYKVPEYFGFNRMSYHEAEVEMEKFRVPQPVAPRK